MKNLFSKIAMTRLATVYLVVAVLLSGVPFTASAAVTIDVKANEKAGA